MYDISTQIQHMANTRLTDAQVDQMKKMVVEGAYPDDIAKHFNIAVSSVHNYKTRFKNQGLKFPSVKGKRPANAIRPSEILKPNQNSNAKTDGQSSNIQMNGSNLKFVLNGVEVQISSGAKSINIGKDSMEIHF